MTPEEKATLDKRVDFWVGIAKQCYENGDMESWYFARKVCLVFTTQLMFGDRPAWEEQQSKRYAREDNA